MLDHICDRLDDIDDKIDTMVSQLAVPKGTYLVSRPLSDYAVSSDHPELADKTTFSQSDCTKCYYLDSMLKLLEEHFKKKAVTISGKRIEELNKAVGGHPDSAHTFEGLKAAVDFYVSTIRAGLVYQYIRDNFVYGENFLYTKKNFVHLTLPFKGNLWQNRVFE